VNIWIVNPYGTLPSEGWREYRSSMLARALSESGHKVCWWISNFEHRSKKNRPIGFIEEPLLPDSVKILSVRSSPYFKNISLERIKYEFLFGMNFKKIANSLPPPDLIILADPSLFYSSFVISHAKKINSKIVLDVLDLWPEQFKVALPKFLKPLSNIIFAPLFWRRQQLVRKVDGVVAVTKDHLKSVRPLKSTPKLVVYLGLDLKKFADDSLKPLPITISKFVENSVLVLVYAGTLGEAYDIPAVLNAAENVIKLNNKVKFIFAGDGPYSQHVLSFSKRFSDNVLFLGKVSSDLLPSLYSICQIGICSYSQGSTVTMPVKLYDYLAGGLNVIYSISGEIDELLKNNFCGFKYEAGNYDDLAGLIISKINLDCSIVNKNNSLLLAATFDESLLHKRYVNFIEEIAEMVSK
jgi:glycosyltransferase involved in cell wall biosynthesis